MANLKSFVLVLPAIVLPKEEEARGGFVDVGREHHLVHQLESTHDCHEVIGGLEFGLVRGDASA